MRRTLILGLLLAALLSACNLIAGAPEPTPFRDLPLVRFATPLSGASVAEGEELIIQLIAEDPTGVGVARVELKIDDLPHHEAMPVVSAAVPIFTVDMNWLARGVGLHALAAIAYRPDGTASDPAIIRVLVVPPEATPQST
jgi:hypothetical protein